MLDLSIDGIEVDIKNTIGSNWTIPSEAMGHPCILLKAQESTSRCSFGLIVIRDDILNKILYRMANGLSRRQGLPRSTGCCGTFPTLRTFGNTSLPKLGLPL